MGDISEIFKSMKEDASTKRNVRHEFYSEIIEQLGATYINNCTYRLDDYNIYTSKGMVMHKSNQGKRIPLQIFLKEKYNIDVDGKQLNEQIKQALR